MPKGVPLTEDEQARRRAEIRDVAVKLFFAKGFTETSIREIAEAAGMGKSTLYDYFKTKDEILISYFSNEIVTLSKQADEISRLEVSANERLRLLLEGHLTFLLENKHFYLKLSMEAQRMGLESQQLIQQNRHFYQDLICRLVEDGIREGTFRKVNPVLAMRIILSSLTPVVFTTRPSGTPHEMLAESIDIILKGIQA